MGPGPQGALDHKAGGPEIVQSLVDKFRMGTYLVIIDSIVVELEKRLSAYEAAVAKFGFLRTLKDLPEDQIVIHADTLHKAYPKDLEESLSDELIYFKNFLNTELVVKELNTATAPKKSSKTSNYALSAEEDENSVNVESMELKIYRLLVEKKLQALFPNIEIAYRIYLTLMVTNCSGERSFSALKRIKNALRSSMTQMRLNNLTLLHVEREIVRKIDFSDMIKEFAIKKSRKQSLI